MTTLDVDSPDLTGGVRESRLGSTSFVGLLVTQFCGAFNDNFFRWFAVLVAQSVVGTTEAIVIGTLCLTAPYLVFAPMAGWLADRFEKRRVIIGCKLAEIVLMLLGTLALVYGNAPTLFVIVTLIGIQSALFGPAKPRHM